MVDIESIKIFSFEKYIELKKSLHKLHLHQKLIFWKVKDKNNLRKSWPSLLEWIGLPELKNNEAFT